MSNETCPTIRVKSPVSDANPSGFIVINESDKTDEHELFEATPAKAAETAKTVAPAAPAWKSA